MGKSCRVWLQIAFWGVMDVYQDSGRTAGGGVLYDFSAKDYGIYSQSTRLACKEGKIICHDESTIAGPVAGEDAYLLMST